MMHHRPAAGFQAGDAEVLNEHATQPSDFKHSPRPFRRLRADSSRYWEPRRVTYNLILFAVTVLWALATWPHFRPMFRWSSLGLLLTLALLANLCYCAAYLLDLPMQSSAWAAGWRRWRRGLWLLGTAVAVLLANYWIVDEIYPYVH